MFPWWSPPESTASPAPTSAAKTAEVMTSPAATSPASATVAPVTGRVLLEALALVRAIHPVLSIRIEVLGVPTARRAILFEVLFMLLHVGLAVRMLLVEILFVLLRVRLRVGVLLIEILFVLLGLLFSLLRVHAIPGAGAVVVFLPA